MNTLNIFLIYLSQVSWTQEQKTIKTITDREKRGSKRRRQEEGNCFHAVYGLETGRRNERLHSTGVHRCYLISGWRVTIHLRGWKGGRGSSNSVSTRSKGLDWLAPGLSPDPIVSARVVMGCARVTGDWGGDEVREHRGNGESKRREKVERMRGWRRCEETRGGDRQMGRNIEGRLLRFAALSYDLLRCFR